MQSLSLQERIRSSIWLYKATNNSRHFGSMVFRPDGRVAGYRHPNECFWELDDEALTLRNFDRVVTTRFRLDRFNPDHWEGDILVAAVNHKHILSSNQATPILLHFN